MLKTEGPSYTLALCGKLSHFSPYNSLLHMVTWPSCNGLVSPFSVLFHVRKFLKTKKRKITKEMRMAMAV